MYIDIWFLTLRRGSWVLLLLFSLTFFSFSRFNLRKSFSRSSYYYLLSYRAYFAISRACVNHFLGALLCRRPERVYSKEETRRGWIARSRHVPRMHIASRSRKRKRKNLCVSRLCCVYVVTLWHDVVRRRACNRAWYTIEATRQKSSRRAQHLWVFLQFFFSFFSLNITWLRLDSN